MSPAYSLHAAWQVGPDPVHHMVKLTVSQAEGTAHPRAREVSSVWLGPKEWLDRWGGVEDVSKMTSGIPRFVCMPVCRYAGLCRLSGQGVLLSHSPPCSHERSPTQQGAMLVTSSAPPCLPPQMCVVTFELLVRVPGI